MNDASIAIAPRLQRRVPYMAEYAGYWHIEPNAAQILIDRLQSMDISQHLAAVSADGDPARVSVRRGYSYEITDGVAVISLEGILMKHEASMDESTSTAMMRNTVRKMRMDEGVRAAVIVVDSPGGTVSGAYDLADDIAALAAAKPTYGYAQNLSASAGYLMLSQCREISGGRTTLIGSIGTYASVRDSYSFFRKQGIKVHLIGSGGVKGAGVPGTKITAEHLAKWQKEVDGLNAAFIDTVSKGRRLDRATVESLADGRVHIAGDAKDLRLIDRVESLDELVSRVSKSANGASARTGETRVMAVGTLIEVSADETLQEVISDAADAVSDTNEATPESTSTPAQPEASDAGNSDDEPSQTQPDAAIGETMFEKNADDKSATQGSPNPTSPARQAATIPQIKEACPGAPASFVLAQAEAGATVQEAQSAFILLQSEQLKAEKEAAKSPARTPARPVRQSAAEGGEDDDGESQSDNAVESFNSAVEKEMSRPGSKLTRKQAVSRVITKQPKLHREYLEALNTGRKARDLIADKFGDVD